MLTAQTSFGATAAASTGAARQDLTSSAVIKCFMVMAVLVYADYFNALTVSSLGTERYFKYTYFVLVLGIYVHLAMTGDGMRLRFDAPNIFLGFTLIALIPFLLQTAAGEEVNSYASAFAATLVYSTSAVFPVHRFATSTERLERAAHKLLLCLCILYTVELAVRKFSGIDYFAHVINDTNHVKSGAYVALIGLAVLRSDRKGLFVGLALLGASAILRPSSTVVLATAICIPLAFALRRGWLRSVSLAGHSLILLAASMPLVLHFFPEVQQAVLAAEGWVKEDVLQGHSNTGVRLAIKEMALERWQDSSFLFGEFFSGSTNVQIAHVFPWWMKEHNPLGLAAIHSDYVSMLLQGGMTGYLLFNLALILTLRTAIAHTRRQQEAKQSPGLSGLGVVAVVSLVLYGSSNPFLQYFGAAHVIWFLLFLSNLAGRASLAGQGRAGS